jgi:predicted ATPase
MIADGWDDDPTIELRMREGDTLLYRSSFEDLLNEYIHFCPVLRGDVKYEVSFSGPLEKILNVVAKRPELKDKWNELLSEVLDFNCKVDTSYTRSGALQLLNITTRSNVALEPFSLAQLLYVVPLVLAARPSSTILIEEPEIHLHPRAQAKLVERLAKISEEYNLQLILTTHSEHVLFRLLTLVREGTLKPEELKIYYFEREKTMPPKISIEELKVNEKGELDKGLKGFFEADLNELSRFVRAKSGG